MGVSKLSAVLRIVLGISLVGFALGIGLLQRSPLTLPFAGAGFALAFGFGKLRAWRHARDTGKLKAYWLSQPLTFFVQLVLVSVLYLIGFGLSALAGGAATPAPFGPGDVIWPLAAGIAASILGLYIDRIEGKPSSFLPTWAEAIGETTNGSVDSAAPALHILPDAVTPQSFFSSIHCTHGSYASAPGGAFDSTPNEKSAGRTDDDIVRAEAQLGRALPDGLIALYAVQNGGSIADLCIPLADAPELAAYEQVILPFSGYNDLLPLELLRTVWDAVTDYADPDNPDEAGAFPDGAKAMIILAQWYRETLFLDYNQPGAPRIGFCDFDDLDSDRMPKSVTWWPDFETFFASLRHFETL
jgi:SMI1 / KNR4 family (SUKH-1)